MPVSTEIEVPMTVTESAPEIVDEASDAVDEESAADVPEVVEEVLVEEISIDGMCGVY